MSETLSVQPSSLAGGGFFLAELVDGRPRVPTAAGLGRGGGGLAAADARGRFRRA